MGNAGNGSKGGVRLNMRITLILFALIPLVIVAATIGTVSIKNSKKELKGYTRDSLVQVIRGIGTSFDNTVLKNQEVLKSYMAAPVIKDALQNPDDPEIAAKAEQYTLDYFGALEGWEGLYLADWNTKVLTHPNAGAIGMVLREGDSLTGLQNNMLSADSGVFNTGIMESPVSGQRIMSMYAPIMIDGQPAGFVGGAFYIQNIASALSDVSGLSLSSAYVYFVDHEGIMLHHPDEEKVGNPVENEAVKGLVAQISEGKHPEPDLIEYLYKGKTKYAGYYIGANESYIAVLTADEQDVLTGLNNIRRVTIIICIICVVLFGTLAVLIERLISVPIIEISKSLDVLSTGDVTTDCKANTHIRETLSLLGSFYALRDALQQSMGSVKEAAMHLNESIVGVDSKTVHNVDSVAQINAAINEVAQTSQSVAGNAQDMAEKAAYLGDNVEQLNANVQNLYDDSQKIKAANSDATDCMKSVYEGANESVRAMQDIGSKINETNSAIADIGTAIQAIESIASQTNLLSLNASIEAARAGEAGRGFAVVADEIRSLADSSADSAKEIKQIIEKVMELSQSTVEISNRVFDVISREQADIEKAQEKFIVLSDSVESSVVEIDTIKQMTYNLDQIKTDLASATTELGAISEELGASAEEVAASCQTVTDACLDTQKAATDMRKVNANMSEAVAYFKLN
ncbi:MAG: hypothetical protein IK078_01550 [Lachnospiraceae bacterium]|nr:hypothetical protein [Lachnospiraceae bacterium]